MKYSDWRTHIQSGDILAWDTKGKTPWTRFLIWLGRLGQLTQWTHVGIAWVVGERVLILEAVASGIRDYPLSLDLPVYHLARNTPLTKKQLAFALSKKGEKYSYWECFLSWLKKNNSKNSSWQCAEYVSAVLNLDCQNTPSAVVDYVMEQGASQVLLTPDL